MAVRHGKMTQERKEQLLEKIIKVASNDVTAFAGTESDIKVSKNEENGDIVIDLVAHFMKTDENDQDRMNISYAAAKSTIKNATIQQQEKASQLMFKIIQSSLKGMKMPGGEEELAAIQQSLNEQAQKQMIINIQ